MAEYAHPEVLVSTDWTAQHLEDPTLRLVEVDVDKAAYEEGHLPNAVGWDWDSQLCDNVQRDIIQKDKFEELMSSAGISNDTTVILYGDNNNWFAAWAFWQLKIYGHKDVRLMDGGRKKWIAEGRELTTEKPSPSRTEYRASGPDNSIRSFLPDVRKAVENHEVELVDVRSPAEFSGEVLSPPGLPETCQRGGHIPGAANIPWGQAVNEDGTFKSYEDLKKLYEAQGITGSKPVIAYCRIGERSSHSWFVLRYLLGIDNVTNYDGSWTEWGNLVGAPIERGAATGAAQ